MADPKAGGEKGNVEHIEYINGKQGDLSTIEKLETDSRTLSNDEDKLYNAPPEDARDLVTEVLLVEDDPTLNPWTFRTWFIGLALSVFTPKILL